VLPSRVSAVSDDDGMDEIWDGHRMVDQRTGQMAYRVRGARVCDANTNELRYRLKDYTASDVVQHCPGRFPTDWVVL
jgi:hypothetical protein